MNRRAPQAALVTKTLVSSSASALAEPHTLTLASFFDLCALIDACVILDDLQMVQSPDPLRPAPLVSRLKEEDLLTEFHPRLSRSDLRRVLLRLPEELGDRLPAGWVPGYGPPGPHPHDEDRRDPAVLDETGAVRGIDFSTGLDDLLWQLEQMVDYPSITNQVQQRMQRSLGYLVAAAAHGMDYFPDYDRVPFAAAALRKLYQSLPVQLYERVSDALGQRIGKEELISEWTMHATLAIPAASAIVFHRSRSLTEVPERILEVRSEFTRYRRRFGEFKAELRDADSIDKRAALLNTYRALLAEASGPRQQIVSMGEMLNMTEAMVKVAAAPVVPTSYGASLVAQPTQWLRRWWLRRPIAVLFRLDGKLPQISEYRRLVAKLWGDAVHERLLDKLGDHPEALGRTMRYF